MLRRASQCGKLLRIISLPVTVLCYINSLLSPLCLSGTLCKRFCTTPESFFVSLDGGRKTITKRWFFLMMMKQREEKTRWRWWLWRRALMEQTSQHFEIFSFTRPSVPIVSPAVQWEGREIVARLQGRDLLLCSNIIMSYIFCVIATNLRVLIRWLHELHECL